MPRAMAVNAPTTRTASAVPVATNVANLRDMTYPLQIRRIPEETPDHLVWLAFSCCGEISAALRSVARGVATVAGVPR